MEIDNFSSLLEILASVSIAFVAVEYVASYTKLLCEKVFLFKDFIAKSFNECRHTLPDDSTLQGLNPNALEGFELGEKIEGIKRKCEQLTQKINEKETTSNNQIITYCTLRCLSPMSIAIFINCLLILFVNGFRDMLGIDIFMISLCSCFNLFMLLGWFFSEKNPSCILFNYNRLMQPIIWAIICVFVSISIAITCHICGIANNDNTAKASFYLVCSNLVSSFINYLVAAFKVYFKAKKFRKTIREDKEQLLKECSETQKEAQEVMTFTKVGLELTGNHIHIAE